MITIMIIMTIITIKITTMAGILIVMMMITWTLQDNNDHIDQNLNDEDDDQDRARWWSCDQLLMHLDHHDHHYQHAHYDHHDQSDNQNNFDHQNNFQCDEDPHNDHHDQYPAQPKL